MREREVERKLGREGRRFHEHFSIAEMKIAS
jgi:hypothetical protein